MPKERLLAFTDGVIAILITIMVLELHVPEGTHLAALRPLVPVLLTYVLSFVHLGIYWNNHHHLFQAAERVTGAVLWANLHLLFWLSLLPFATGWMGENHFDRIPTMAYGVVLVAAALAYFVMVRTLLGAHGDTSVLARAVGNDVKGKISPAVYVTGIALAGLVTRWLGVACYVVVALIWLVPDRRFEPRDAPPRVSDPRSAT